MFKNKVFKENSNVPKIFMDISKIKLFYHRKIRICKIRAFFEFNHMKKYYFKLQP